LTKASKVYLSCALTLTVAGAYAAIIAKPLDPLPRLVEQAVAVSPSERMDAACSLVDLGTHQAAATLVDMLASEEDALSLRYIAEACIQHSRRWPKCRVNTLQGRQSAIVSYLCDLASSAIREEANRTAATWVLGELEDRDAIPTLAALQGESEAETVAKGALRKLGYYDTGAAYEIK